MSIICNINLLLPPPDNKENHLLNTELEKTCSRYAETWENDGMGNIYLDMTGMTSLFGSPSDHAGKVLADITKQTGIKPAAAVSANKLVSKVATGVISSAGFIHVKQDTEAEFLHHQDIKLLPGMGKKLLNIASVTGIKEIGEIACLSESNAISLFGKHGHLLRKMALGIDNTPVINKKNRTHIVQRADFEIDTIEEAAIMGAIYSLCEIGGLKMRNEKLGVRNVRLGVVYSDGAEVQNYHKSKNILVTDNEIANAAFIIYKKIITRRIRISSIYLSLEDFTPLGYQPDLFEPESEIKQRNLQQAIDKIQNRYGLEKITKGLVIAARKYPDRKLALINTN